MANKQVLIVEDCHIQSIVLKKILESENYSVLGVCRSGEDAIGKLEGLKPDLILMDIFLAGGLNGIETMSQIREKLDTPTLFITALSGSEIMDQTISVRNSKTLTKPISKPDLLEAISTLSIQQN